MSDNRQMKIGAVLSYFSLFLNIASGLLFTPWMIRQIGQSAYGLYTLANSFIALFLFDFGLSAATARFVAKYRAEGKNTRINDILGAIYKLYLMITLTALAGFLAAFFFLDRMFPNFSAAELSRFRVVYVVCVAFAVVQFPCVTLNGILTAFGKHMWLKLADILYRISFVVWTAAALLLGYGLYALVIVHALAGILAILFKIWAVRKTTPVKVNFRCKERSLYRTVLTFSVWVTVSGFAQRASFNLTPTVLGIVCQEASAAISVFGIISVMESYACLIPGAINGLFLPHISQICAEGRMDRLDSLMNDVGKFQFFVNGLLLAGFAVVGKSFLSLWLGEGYTDAYAGILLVLLPGVYYNSLQIANTTMTVMNKVKAKAKIDCVMAILNVTLAFPLARHFGVTGACGAILIAYTFRAVALVCVYARILPMNMLAFIRNCFVRMTVPAAAAIGAGCVINRLLPDTGWLVLLQKAVLVTGIYTAFGLAMGINRPERKRLLTYLRK